MSRYTEQLKDPRWQRRRLECLQAANWRCQLCSRHEDSLNVHHVHYIKNRAPWEYPDEYLVVLCDECHSIRHEIDEKLVSSLKVALRLVPNERLEAMARHIMGQAMEAMG